MTPASISQENISQESIKKELDELLAMAERSTASIDTLFDTWQETILRTSGCGAIAALLLVAMGITGFAGKNLGLGESAPFVAMFLGILTGYLAYAAFLQFRKMRRTERELRLERHIHGKLVSLLHEQSRRMDIESISFVARATIDIRMRRL